ncbi:MAG TPA: peptidoglycan recognition family protein [Terriglobales bacterium]|jgi:N-acetyl-anhydromuramyl-L-alanine amidase AmpD|nr:peptidoglycan recognition family protein [Terriglobales bacterium]
MVWKPCRIAMLLVFVSGLAAAQELKIVDKPIRYDQERVELTLEYRKQHQGGDPKNVRIDPKAIVLHYTASESFDGTWKYFDRDRIESERALVAANGALNVSAQFLVDRDGTVYRLMPEDWFARHCIGLNQVAIGVENVGDGGKFPLTDAQVAADAALVRYLKQKYPAVQYLIGHSEYRRMERTPLWKESNPNYRTPKSDPGGEFMRRVREKVADLQLEGPPQ